MVTLEEVSRRVESDASSRGYFLHPDPDFLRNLLEGLTTNEELYGYSTCPCRLASGKFEFDRDIICPCDYRNLDVEEYGACYCALYVIKDLFEGNKPIERIPERRPAEKQARSYIMEGQVEEDTVIIEKSSEMKLSLWYCKQCGYVTFREEPPFICPICKARREMFNVMTIKADIHG